MPPLKLWQHEVSLLAFSREIATLARRSASARRHVVPHPALLIKVAGCGTPRNDNMNEKQLFNKIMLRIKTEQRKVILKRKIGIFAFILVISLTGLVPAFSMAWTGFADSGFVQLFSLAFSDTKIVMTYWQNFIFSLLESLPITGLMIAGISLLALLGSLKFLYKNINDDEILRPSLRSGLRMTT